MKKYLLLLVVIFSSAISCQTGPPMDRRRPGERPPQGEQYPGGEMAREMWDHLDMRIEKWNRGRMERSPEILNQIYWENVSFIFARPDGEDHVEGMDEVSGMMMELFHNMPFISDRPLPPPERIFMDDHPSYHFFFENRDQSILLILVFEERDGEWKIIHQRLELHAPGDMAGEPGREIPPVLKALIETADMNRNGQLDDDERRLLDEALSGPHPVSSEIDHFLDRNRNENVDHEEIIQFRRILREREEIEGGAVFPIVTEVDGFLDLNGDGEVQEIEIRTTAEAILRAQQGGDVPERLRQVLDLNKDGRIEREEVIHSMSRYFRPHPVDNDLELDKRLDMDRDGFVGPEEIGLAAGVSAHGPIPPFDDFIEEMRWNTDNFFAEAEEPGLETGTDTATDKDEQDYTSDFYKNIGMVQDKKFAVMGISSNTASVNNETTDGIMVFIENAFVNIGEVSVIDRSNIENILKEQNFQLSNVVDEETAVELGRLTGADIIIVGNISLVGELYYLNIKLLNVTTGEIMGSSISESEGPKYFLDMCNDAVYKLF